MTDRVNALTIVLEEDMREDDVAVLVGAIAQLRGVLSVTANKVTADTYVERMRVRHEFQQKVLSFFEWGKQK